jgi:hypothetical protein
MNCDRVASFRSRLEAFRDVDHEGCCIHIRIQTASVCVCMFVCLTSLILSQARFAPEQSERFQDQ